MFGFIPNCIKAPWNSKSFQKKLETEKNRVNVKIEYLVKQTALFSDLDDDFFESKKVESVKNDIQKYIDDLADSKNIIGQVGQMLKFAS